MSKKERVLPDHILQKCMIKWLQQHKMKSLITLKDRKVYVKLCRQVCRT